MFFLTFPFYEKSNLEVYREKINKALFALYWLTNHPTKDWYCFSVFIIPLQIENNQLKELQNTYAASIHKLGYDNKLLQKDLVKLKAELEMSTRTSQEKYEAALRHTQHAVTEMKEHESR